MNRENIIEYGEVKRGPTYEQNGSDLRLKPKYLSLHPLTWI